MSNKYRRSESSWQQHEGPPSVYRDYSFNRGLSGNDSYSSSGMPQSSQEIGSRFYTDFPVYSFYNYKKNGDHHENGLKDYRRSEERICKDVLRALENCTELDASGINVLYNNGIITLSGIVESKQMKHIAEETIENIVGVHAVKNELQLEIEAKKVIYKER
ncbi:MAG: BON domain-containing protein [Pseudobdellovibrio sp.]